MVPPSTSFCQVHRLPSPVSLLSLLYLLGRPPLTVVASHTSFHLMLWTFGVQTLGSGALGRPPLPPCGGQAALRLLLPVFPDRSLTQVQTSVEAV